jgi:uncharacterized RDD family membrane protein YckC
MSQAAELRDADFDIDPDAPPGFRSQRDKERFTLIFALVAGVVFILQIVLPQMLATIMLPQMATPFGGFTVQMPHSNLAFRWQDELWVPVERVQPGRPPQTVLRVLQPDGAWAENRDVVAPIPIEHCVPDGDKLWIIGSGAVASYQNGQFTTLYSRRKLNQPRAPFVQDGRLSIFDRQPNGQYRWLSYAEGEWVDRAWFEMPRAASIPEVGATVTTTLTPNTAPQLPGQAWQIEALQMVQHEGQTRLYFSTNNQLWSTTFGALPDPASVDAVTDADEPVAADRPANIDPLALPLTWTYLGAERAKPWRVVELDGRLAIVRQFQQQIQSSITANWCDELDGDPFAETNAIVMESLGVVPAPTGATILTDTFPPGGCRQMPLTAAGFGEKVASAQGDIFSMFGGGLLKFQAVASAIPITLMLLLVIVGQTLMARHRDLRYGFGHDTVRLATLGRRTVARIIDNTLYAWPMWAGMAWFYFVGGFDLDRILDALQADWQQVLVTGLLIMLGMMTYGLLMIVVMGALEGWYGWSPGKLACGLRVVRTNLQRCGLFRGVLRQILLIGDGFFTYLVGVLLIGIMPKCQRLGDLASDTIVIEVGSLPAPRATVE